LIKRKIRNIKNKQPKKEKRKKLSFYSRVKTCFFFKRDNKFGIVRRKHTTNQKTKYLVKRFLDVLKTFRFRCVLLAL